MNLSRREWLTGLGGGTAAAMAQPPLPAYTNYFGDLRNHNVVGYAQGSLERSYRIARSHLDFFCFTPHSHWHDIKKYENLIEDKWVNGFAVTRERWPETIAVAKRYDTPGKFVTMAGYEWHSTSIGDYHMVFPDLNAEMTAFNDVRELQAFAAKRGCILIPHHPANRFGHRGANFKFRDPKVSPVLEMYSERGNAEHDRAPFGYIRHTEGGRWTKNNMQALLAEGHRFGIIASTDDHLGFPGAYREGLAVVKATDLSHAAIYDALFKRRTYAVTGDRIGLDFFLNGRTMGQDVPYAPERELKVAAAGWDQLDRVEVLKNNRVIHRDFPMDRETGAGSFARPVVVRFEYGWGPWPALGKSRTADWMIDIRIDGGLIEQVQPCFQSGPLEEGRLDEILERTPRSVKLKSFTALRQQLDDISTKAIVLKVKGDASTKITGALTAPAQVSLRQTFGQLAESNEMLFTGEFPKESAMLHRLVFDEHHRTSFTICDYGEGKSVDWYYVRAGQANGQLAWSSPIWVDMP